VRAHPGGPDAGHFFRRVGSEAGRQRLVERVEDRLRVLVGDAGFRRDYG
jgi:hypothetical protein